MKILIADVLPVESIERIRGPGCEVEFDADLGADDLPDRIPGANVLVVRSTRVTSATVEAADKLSLVIRAGSGTNTIDIDACSEAGVFVSNCPGLNSVAVAELTLAHILAIDRNIPDCVADLRSGVWNKGKYAKLALGLKGRALGIVGFGNIGQEVAKRALAFDMKVLVYDPAVSDSFIERHSCDAVGDIKDLCRRANVLTIHVPLTEQTKDLIDDEAFAVMQPDTVIINTARGGIVDEDAFVRHSEEKNLRGGFDVFADEPGSKFCEFNSPVAQSPRVYGTHHIGASTVQAQIAVAEEVVELIKVFTEGGHIRNCVNLETESRAEAVLFIRHYDRVGVLAEVCRILKQEGINIEDMENMILRGRETACAKIKISRPISDVRKVTEDPAVKDAIIHLDMFEL